MKKIYRLLLLVTIISVFTGCDSWLDVSPKTEVKETDLFSKESGFKTALLGVYIEMVSSNLYGGNLTMSFRDVLAQYYSITSEESTYMPMTIYDYGHADVKPTVSQIWSNMYSIIANLNNLLWNMDQHKELFTADNYNIIKGEALGLRAYLHFDLLRMYAPSYVLGGDALAIPYVNEVTNVPFAQKTVKQVAETCIQDLLEAEALLKETDPIGPAFKSYSENYTNSGQDNAEYDEDGGFLRYRRERMNYYAVTTSLARIYLFLENKGEAYKWAELAVNSGRCSSTSYIFSLYSDKLADYSDYYFNPGLEKEEQLIIPEERKNSIYETDKYGSIDSRWKEWFHEYPNSSTEYMAKYMKASDGKRPVNVSLIAGCEAYYIAAEAATEESDAFSHLNRVRQSFGISASYNLKEGVDDLDAELYAEYRKSFVGEGQLFYYMKRKNFASIEGVVDGNFPSLYTFPLPDTEIEFGNIVNRNK